jgi:hypothetical protein
MRPLERTRINQCLIHSSSVNISVVAVFEPARLLVRPTFPIFFAYHLFVLQRHAAIGLQKMPCHLLR